MRASTVSTKVIAGLLAGSLALIPIGGGFSRVAWAQSAPNAAASPSKGSKQPATSVKAGGSSGSSSSSSSAAPKAAAPADAGAAEAKKRYGAGETKFKAGDYAGALADFEAADAVKPSAQAARYIGVCHDNLQQYPEAAAAYERFLADVPPKMGPQADELRKRLEVIKAMPGKVHVESVPAGASITADGKAAPNPTPTDVELPPGPHTLHVTSAGYMPLDKDVTVAFGSKQDLSVTLDPKPMEPPPPPPVAVAPAPVPVELPPPPQPRSKLPAFITGGLAVAAAGVGTVFGALALSDKSDFNKNPTSSKADDGENHALIADMAFGVAITLGVTSAVLFLSRDEAPASTATKTTPTVAKNAVSVSALPVVTPHGGGASAVVRF
jgi:hypothetical protein